MADKIIEDLEHLLIKEQPMIDKNGSMLEVKVLRVN